MNRKPRLTAIISLFNSGRWLHNRIRNLMETTLYQKGELLIFAVNSQSPDPQDDAIANQYAGKPNFHYEIQHEKTSCYGSWNYAIQKTNTTYLTNANTDDIIAPDAYDKLIHAIETTGSLLAYPDWYLVVEENQSWNQAQQKGQLDRIGHYNPDRDQMSCGHFPIWKREIHDKVGLFDPSFKALGDAELWYRLWITGHRNFLYYGEPLGGYLWRYGQNLWHRVDDPTRAKEWEKLHATKPGKLNF